MCIPGNSQSRIKYTFQECYESMLTDKVAAFFRWTFGIVVGICSGFDFAGFGGTQDS